MTQYAQPPLFGTIQALDDEIDAFWAEKPRRAALPLTRIHCRVCDANIEQAVDVPGLLCPLCREDLGKTELYIRQVLASAELAFVNAYDRLRADVAHADEYTHARYQKVLDALGAAYEGTADAASVQRRYEAAKAKGDGLSALLREKEAAEEIALEYQRLQAWAERGLSEVEAAREVQ